MNLVFNLETSILIFIISSGLIWYFCTKLSKIVDFIDHEFNLGNAFGGTIILALVTNLPEIAITINGAIKGDIDLAVGNVLGGITVQSSLLILFDFASRKQSKPLSTLTSSKTSILQGLFLVATLTAVILGKQFHNSFVFSRTTPPELLIAFVWITSMLSMKKFQKQKNHFPNNEKNKSKFSKTSALIWLIIVSIVVLIFGVLLEITSSTIAQYYEINGVIFGATILALVTSLPEISGGLAFVRNKSYEPIISDIFGGNTFLPVLFIPATIITNKAILPSAKNIDIYLTSIAILITLTYIIGMIIKNSKRYFGLGADSWVTLTIYIFSIIGMFYL